MVEVYALVVSTGIAVVHYCLPFWGLSNLVALCFAGNAISLLMLDTFYTGAALLAGLFFYDIFFVFYSDRLFSESVMVSVAQNFEAP